MTGLAKIRQIIMRISVAAGIIGKAQGEQTEQVLCVGIISGAKYHFHFILRDQHDPYLIQRLTVEILSRLSQIFAECLDFL